MTGWYVSASPIRQENGTHNGPVVCCLDLTWIRPSGVGHDTLDLGYQLAAYRHDVAKCKG